MVVVAVLGAVVVTLESLWNPIVLGLISDLGGGPGRLFRGRRFCVRIYI
jgi:hypothetical protein